jgi:hypothetical protein
VDDDDDESSVSMQRSIDALTVDITQLVRASESKLRELIKYQQNTASSEDSQCDEQSKCAHNHHFHSTQEHTDVAGTAAKGHHFQAEEA